MLPTKSVRVACFIRAGVIVLLIGWAALQAYSYRFFEYYVDGLSYLEMAEYFSKGQWYTGLSSTWSPLYPLIISIFISVGKLSPDWALLKLVNVVIYIFLIGSFVCFLHWFLAFYNHLSKESNNAGTYRIPAPILESFGYILFAWCFFCLSGAEVDTPDALAAIFLFLATGLILKMKIERSGPSHHISLGLLLGLGYLAKAIVLPLAPVYLWFLSQTQNTWKEKWLACSLSAITMLLIACPLISLLSQRAGELTISPVGKLNYVWYVTLQFQYPHAQANARATLPHPTRLVFAHPAVYEFAQPVGGTYPPWFDCCYWYCGIKPHLDPAHIFVASIFNIIFYCLLVGPPLVVILLPILLIHHGFGLTRTGLSNNIVLLVLAAAGFGLYCLATNHFVVAPYCYRYFSFFVLCFLLGLISSLRLPASDQSSRTVLAVFAALCMLCGIPVVRELRQDFRVLAHPDLSCYKVAAFLTQIGLKPGDYLARLGVNEVLVDWAKLVNMKIVADIPSGEDFWHSSPETRRKCIKQLRVCGVKALVYCPAPISSASQYVIACHRQNFHLLSKLLGLHLKETFVPGHLPPRSEGWLQVGKMPCFILRI